MSKKYFKYALGGNQNTLKLKIKQICGKIKVSRSAMDTIQFCFGLVHFKLKIANLDFFR